MDDHSLILSTQERKYENENVQRKFCQESSNLPFAVPGNVKLKLPNDWKTANFAGLYYPHFTTFRNETLEYY